jgi:hypothetical protein
MPVVTVLTLRQDTPAAAAPAEGEAAAAAPAEAGGASS